jgi:hypothetical protein
LSLSLSIATTTVQLIGHCRVFDNPRLLAERKAKKLKSLLESQRSAHVGFCALLLRHLHGLGDGMANPSD